MSTGAETLSKEEVRAQGVQRRIRRSLVAIVLKMIPYLLIFVVLYCLVLVIGSKGLGLDESKAFARTMQFVSYFLRVAFLLEITRRYFDEVLLVTERGLVQQKGLLSFSYKTASIKYEDIREIRVEQTILQRFFHFGTLKLGTASTRDYEIRFSEMANPHDFSKWVQEERIDRHLERTSRD